MTVGGGITEIAKGQAATVINALGRSSVVLVCEHASNFFPIEYNALGLTQDIQNSHIAWDPGAMGVAAELAKLLDARLVAAGVSRLIYDCNRPPNSPAAMPKQSEVYDIPGNSGLTAAQKADRAARFHHPFHDTVDTAMSGVSEMPIIVTIHSFTKVYQGRPRAVEIGILHDTDTRLADEMLNSAHQFTELNVQRNEPYSATDGVTHTLQLHAIQNGYLNVMLEIRNDLIANSDTQKSIATMLADLLTHSIQALTPINQKTQKELSK